MIKPPASILVDARNWGQVKETLFASMQTTKICGLDIETHDADRHSGLNAFCKYDEDGRKAKSGKLVFDMQRTTVTGLSLYFDGEQVAYYFNLAHADVENRLPFWKLRELLELLPEDAYFICHNAPFELTAMGNALNFEMERVVCTLQMAVSAYGPDDFPVEEFRRKRLGTLATHMDDLIRHSINFDLSVSREPKPKLQEIMGKITAKESDAAHSYNGWIDELAWGYGLKKAVERHFGYKMSTFEETLDGNVHMGCLTGEQVAVYGAEDAFWAVKLFHHLLGMMAQRSPKALSAFFTQENPMIHLYSEVWRKGCRIDYARVLDLREEERHNFAQLLRELKVAILETGGFRAEPDVRLVKRESWYAKNHARYRKLIWDWANMPDSADPFEQCNQMRSPVSNAWADDLGVPQSAGVNLVHYMPQRTMLYDLLMLPLKVVKGKVQSDGECRGKLLDKVQKVIADKPEEEDDEDEALTGWKAMAPAAAKVLECLTKMSQLEQRMKLYLTPYVHLTDRQTNRVYPVLSSQLATRRMASQHPNGMQLAKRGESVKIRGLWLPDYDDHVIISRDWSAIELVIIGELSKDPEFARVYGQIPHGDLHLGATADILSVEVPGLNEEQLKSLKQFEKAGDFCDHWGTQLEASGRLFTDLKGNSLEPKKALKYWRTEVGKGANFNFWYSGWLGTIGERLGWGQDTTAQAVDRYTSRFWVAESWRKGLIAEGRKRGYVELPDGHRRYRYEATEQWMQEFIRKWPLHDDMPMTQGFNAAVSEIARRIWKRAGNQLVNSVVQGTCATLAKRTLIRMKQLMKQYNLTDREIRFMLPIHDELVYSCHKDYVVVAEQLLKTAMNDHKDLFPTLMIDSSPAIGLTFEPWTPKTTLGQVELYEPPAEIVGKELADTRLDADGIRLVTDWLFAERKRLAA